MKTIYFSRDKNLSFKLDKNKDYNVTDVSDIL